MEHASCRNVLRQKDLDVCIKQHYEKALAENFKEWLEPDTHRASWRVHGAERVLKQDNEEAKALPDLVGPNTVKKIPEKAEQGYFRVYERNRPPKITWWTQLPQADKVLEYRPKDELLLEGCEWQRLLEPR